jgi:serine/threonine protein kinase
MQRAGLPSPAPFGFVELTPEREYLLVAEFFDGAVELGEAQVDDQLINDGLGIIRRLWDAGLAHRDIKPANLLVRDGRLLLIDVAFVEARPSPWRQAVDLANMMLCLALRSSPERVYRRALQYFTVEEICEGFAAARGLALPSQLRHLLRAQGRDLHAEFVRLLPSPPRPIRVQGCGQLEPLWLMAQSVPSASLIPCVELLPAGWRVAEVTVNNGRSVITLDHDRSGRAAMVVTLTASCDRAGTKEVASEQRGATRWYRARDNTRGYEFPGGCVTQRFRAAAPSAARMNETAASDLGFITREELGQALSQRSHGRLELDP